MVLISFLKALLNIFNIVFICVGITLIGIGIWTAVEKVYVSLVIGDSLFRAASYLIICVGVITIGVCIVGLLGVLKEKKTWLWAVESVMVDNMRRSLVHKYGKDSDVTDAWDQLQSELGCCAVSETALGYSVLFEIPYVDDTRPMSNGEKDRQDSWPIYKRTEFFRKQLCYKRAGDHNFVNHSKGMKHNVEMVGCYSKARSLMLNQSDIIVAMGFVFGIIMIGGMVLTFLVLRALKAEEEEKIKEKRRPENHDASLDLL
ncbi:tetraspanin [Elysia marginata]|uniref:Tetraspanin n=1 Tax=Elysia marginata TaxID=1093978 RepID=A0AAV4FK86_9GAST|nr:tetraspanin [Elysia marginata]